METKRAKQKRGVRNVWQMFISTNIVVEFEPRATVRLIQNEQTKNKKQNLLTNSSRQYTGQLPYESARYTKL